MNSHCLKITALYDFLFLKFLHLKVSAQLFLPEANSESLLGKHTRLHIFTFLILDNKQADNHSIVNQLT